MVKCFEKIGVIEDGDDTTKYLHTVLMTNQPPSKLVFSPAVVEKIKGIKLLKMRLGMMNLCSVQ